MHVLFLLLPLCFLFFIFYRKNNFTVSLIRSVVTWLCFLIGGAEILSFFEILTFESLLYLWLGITCLLTVFVMQHVNDHRKNAIVLIKKFSKKMSKPGLFIAASLLGTIGLAALVSAPNTYDAETYHLSRIEHWIQNRTLQPQPTHDVRQISMPIASEIVLMHFRIFTHADYFSHLLQWFSLTLCAFLVYQTYKLLGTKTKSESAPFFVLTLPMAILQATSAKNDLVLSLLLCIFVYHVFTYRHTVTHVLFTGLTLGLLLLTKGTAYVYAIPFLFLLLFTTLRSFGAKGVFSLIGIACLALVLNIGFFHRNIVAFSHPLGPYDQEPKYTNDIFSLEVGLSNTFKNITLHLGTPNQELNDSLQHSLVKFHNTLFSLNINDHRTMWQESPFSLNPFNLNEDIAGNPLHLLLIALAGIYLVTHLYKTPAKMKLYALGVFISFFLFSFFLRWQIWNSRLQLPFFILSAPFVAYWLENISAFSKKTILILMIVLSLPVIFMNENRPLLGERSVLIVPRITQYFNSNQEMETSYRAAVDFVLQQNVSSLGLIFPHGNIPEYLLFLLFREEGHPVTIEHIEIGNDTQNLKRDRQVQYETIICIDCRPDVLSQYQVAGYKIKNFGQVNVFSAL